jgi:ATP-dependent helicase STH1/SNF2
VVLQIYPNNRVDVVLTSYEFLINKKDCKRMAALKWHYLILDEGHRIKNSECRLSCIVRKYKINHKLLLSGTPLQNHLSELWSLLNFLLPDMFSSAEEFDSWFGNKLEQAGTAVEGQCTSDVLRAEQVLIITNRLHQVLRPFLLRRTKDVLETALPAKIERSIACPTSEYQLAMLQLLKDKGKEATTGSVQGVNNVIMEMRKVRTGSSCSLLASPCITNTCAWLYRND